MTLYRKDNGLVMVDDRESKFVPLKLYEIVDHYRVRGSRDWRHEPIKKVMAESGAEAMFAAGYYDAIGDSKVLEWHTADAGLIVETLRYIDAKEVKSDVVYQS